MEMITIDKLSLQLSALSEEEGRKLAELLAEELAIVSLPAGCSHVPTVGVNVLRSPGVTVNALSQLIAAEVLRQLDWTL